MAKMFAVKALAPEGEAVVLTAVQLPPPLRLLNKTTDPAPAAMA